MKMASKTMVALYFLIALAVAASALIKEDLIQIPDALNVEENQGESPDGKQFIFNPVNQLNE